MMRSRVVVAVPWPVLPAFDGRRAKALARSRRWSMRADVEIVTLGASEGDAGVVEIAPGLIERRVPCGPAVVGRLDPLFSPLADCGVFFALSVVQAPHYRQALRAACSTATLAVACTPFTFAELRSATPLPIVLDAQAVEWMAADDVFPDDACGREMRRAMARIEQRAVRTADAVIVATASDKAVFGDLRGSDAAVAVSLPLDLSDTACPSRERRAHQKANSNFAGRTVALFAGSQTYGNVQSVKAILRAAPAAPDVFFLIVGSVVEAYRQTRPLPNVGFTGVLGDEQFAAALLLADVCLELGASGASLSAKLLAYVTSGAPLIADASTAAAAGLGPGDFLAAPRPDALGDVIRAVVADRGGALRAQRAFSALQSAVRTNPCDDIVTWQRNARSGEAVRA